MNRRLSPAPGWHFVVLADGALEHIPGWKMLARYVWLLATKAWRKGQ